MSPGLDVAGGHWPPAPPDASHARICSQRSRQASAGLGGRSIYLTLYGSLASLASLRWMSDSLPYGSLASLRRMLGGLLALLWRMPSGLLALLWRMPSGLLVSLWRMPGGLYGNLLTSSPVSLRLMPGDVHGILFTGSLTSSHRFGGCPTACHRLARIASVDAWRLARVALGDVQ